MADLLVVIVILAVVGAAVFYIVKEKRKGVQCIGCPAAGQCAHKKNGSCSCGEEKHS